MTISLEFHIISYAYYKRYFRFNCDHRVHTKPYNRVTWLCFERKKEGKKEELRIVHGKVNYLARSISKPTCNPQ